MPQRPPPAGDRAAAAGAVGTGVDGPVDNDDSSEESSSDSNGNVNDDGTAQRAPASVPSPQRGGVLRPSPHYNGP
eukprot:9327807-Prorocentrum_lima.AAC.1